MKKILILIMVFYATSLYARAYVVVKSNGAIKTVEEKALEVLQNSDKRYAIDEYVSIDNELNYWGEEGITLRPEANEIIASRIENKRKAILSKAYKMKLEIEEIEQVDDGDWSIEKAKWQKIIDDNIKAKGV